MYKEGKKGDFIIRNTIQFILVTACIKFWLSFFFSSELKKNISISPSYRNLIYETILNPTKLDAGCD
jgi:hypothetical protein